nr:hypothetical protein [uncultured Bacteroides sp.]
MSYIDNTRRSLNSPYEITVCITKEECKVLLPFIEKACKEVKLKYDKYEDIHESGEATERQESMRQRFFDKLSGLENLLSSIHTILK